MCKSTVEMQIMLSSCVTMSEFGFNLRQNIVEFINIVIMMFKSLPYVTKVLFNLKQKVQSNYISGKKKISEGFK